MARAQIKIEATPSGRWAVYLGAKQLQVFDRRPQAKAYADGYASARAERAALLDDVADTLEGRGFADPLVDQLRDEAQS